MSESEHPEPNPESGEPSGDETLPEHSPPEGGSSRDFDEELKPHGGKGGHETHGAGEHDHPND